MNNIIATIRNSKKIGITFHVSPDGDALGSALALHLALNKLNIDSYIISKDGISSNLSFLPYAEEIDGSVTTLTNNTDLLIVLDCGNIERIDADIELTNIKSKIINIDHHISNDLYGDINLIDIDSSAVGEIIYKLINKLEVIIDKNIATCLYVSIITDTGSFKHSNTTEITHKIAGKLISTGINFSEIHRLVFENQDFLNLKFYGKILNNMILDDSICIMEISRDMINSSNVLMKDLSEIISLGSKVKEAEVTVLFKEQENLVKVSLRSKSKVNVKNIAEHFNGGGHERAAGLSIECSLEEAKQNVVKEIKKEMNLWME